MNTVVIKKQKSKARYRRVSVDFQQWLKENPNATSEEKAAQFNAFADAEFYRENLETRTRTDHS